MADPKNQTQLGIICIRCEKVHEQCRAHARTGLPCGRKPSPYMEVCTMHGGASPQALRAAARRQANAIAVQTYDADHEAILAAEGLEPIGDPLIELGKLAAASKHLMDALGSRVNALDALRFTDAKGTEQLASEVSLYERAMDRTARLLQLLVAAGFEERRVKVDEQTAAQFTAVLNAVLSRLDLAPEVRATVPGIVVEELKALEAQQHA